MQNEILKLEIWENLFSDLTSNINISKLDKDASSYPGLEQIQISN